MMAKHKTTVRLISPSSRGRDHILELRIKEMENRGLRVLYDEPRLDSSWPFTAAGLRDRADALINALEERDSQIILCTRGGYGASDLLPFIPWKSLEKAPEKWVVGFSDISAIHSALVTKLGWKTLHAPMPQSGFWNNAGLKDAEELFAIVLGEKKDGRLQITAGFNTPLKVGGWLFGGCLSVLTNLIGTPYLPSAFNGAILFWEDIAEGPGRLMRMANQWHQAGLLEGVRAVVLGRLVDLDKSNQFREEHIAKEMSERFKIPFFVSPDFGHCAPNYPLPLKAEAVVTSTELRWQLAGARHAGRV